MMMISLELTGQRNTKKHMSYHKKCKVLTINEKVKAINLKRELRSTGLFEIRKKYLKMAMNHNFTQNLL